MAFQILNPLPGGRKFTTAKRARAYIDSGQAVQVGSNGLRFKGTDEQHMLTVEQAINLITGKFYDRAVTHGRSIRRREAKHVPFAGDVRRMGVCA